MNKPWNIALETGLAAVKLALKRLAGRRRQASESRPGGQQCLRAIPLGQLTGMLTQTYSDQPPHRARFAVLSEESGFQCPPGMSTSR